jgi:hypothetical protein
MKRTKTLVYVGPTLSVGEVRELLPDATVMPPAAVGDILKAAHRKDVARIAIIDGYFERMAAVWHKEILVAIERGIEVWGAASMGALRAAELAPFGMRGVGVIFDWYRRGVITADDEVAIAHLPAAQGYRAVSDALVNIRHTLAKSRHKNAKELLAQAQATFYRERSWNRLVPGVPLIDLKAADARLLLKKLRTSKPAARRKIRVPRTWALRQLEELML